MSNVEAIFLFGVGAVLSLCWGFGELHYEAATMLNFKTPSKTITLIENPETFYFLAYSKIALGALFSIFTLALFVKR